MFQKQHTLKLNGFGGCGTFSPFNFEDSMDQLQSSLGIFLGSHVPIATNPCFQVQRLTDVKQRTIRPVKEIDARDRRQRTEKISPEARG